MVCRVMAERSREASKMLNRTFELKHKNHWVADVIMLNLALWCFVQTHGHSQGSAHCLTFCNPLWGHSLWGCWVSSNLEHVCGVAGIHQQHKGRNLRGTMREFSFSVQKFFGSFNGCPQAWNLSKNLYHWIFGQTIFIHAKHVNCDYFC